MGRDARGRGPPAVGMDCPLPWRTPPQMQVRLLPFPISLGLGGGERADDLPGVVRLVPKPSNSWSFWPG